MAYAEIEDTGTWKWFLRTLIEDLVIQQNTSPWTIMSDRQKGLINAVNLKLPHPEHRFRTSTNNGRERYYRTSYGKLLGLTT